MAKKSRKVEILGPEQSYVELVDETHALRERYAPRFPLRHSAAGFCSRRLAYDLESFLGIEKHAVEEEEPHVTRLFSLGNSVEYQSIQSLQDLKRRDPKAEIKYRQQVVTLMKLPDVGKYKGPIIEGSNDLVVYFEGSRGVGDVKSKKDKFSASHKSDWDGSVEKFDEMRSLVRIPSKTVGGNAWWADDLVSFLEELEGWDSFFVHNFVQLNTYACSDFFVERGVDHAFIYRYNKNDSRHLEIRFRPSPELYEHVQEKFLTIWKKVAGGKGAAAVGRDYHLGSIVCGFCPHRAACWEGDDALRAFFRTLGHKKSFPVPLTEVRNGSKVESSVREMLKIRKMQDDVKVEEAKALKILTAEGVERFRLSTGEVFELKLLKSPFEHLEIRRSK